MERLATEVARLAGETKTEAVRRALADRRSRLELRVIGRARRDKVRRVMEEEIWPRIPASVRGKAISKEEREEILGLAGEGA